MNEMYGSSYLYTDNYITSYVIEIASGSKIVLCT